MSDPTSTQMIQRGLSERACAAEAAGWAVLDLPVWSRIDFVPTLAAGVFDLDQIERLAFNYALGGVIPGSTPERKATPADTNLKQASSTPNNWDWEMHGLAVYVIPASPSTSIAGSNPVLLGKLIADMDLVLSLSNTNIWQLGNMDHYPAPGGLFGQQLDNNVTPDVLSSFGERISYMSLGRPDAESFRHWNPIYTWSSQSSGDPDTLLTISCQPRREISIPQAATRAAIAVTPGVTSVGQPAFTAAESIGVFLKMVLMCRSVGKRSSNV